MGAAFWLSVASPVGAQSSGEFALPEEIRRDGPNGAAIAQATRVGVPPRIDGRLDDEVWQLAAPLTDFRQRVPDTGAPASESTEARLLYDDQYLYIGIRCFDRRSDRLWAKGMIRDDLGFGDDAVTLLLDPNHDHRGGYIFAVSVHGSRTDGQLLGQSREEGYNIDWDGYWIGRSSRDEHGWSVEYAIPFKTLRFREQAVPVWSMIIRRHINRKNEESYWPYINRSGSIYRPADGGHLVGIQGVTPGRNVEVRPYALAGARRNPGTPASGLANESTGGVDLQYGVTSGLTASLTVNTDFAQVEADEQQINLSRFSLFFPEKRNFFLEGARLFDFGVAREAQVFFSRRIGLSENGREVPLAYGARLAGKTGPYSIGLLQMRSRADADRAPANSYRVARLRRDVLGNSRIGMIATDRSSHEGRDNRVVGVDASFLFWRYFQMTAFAAKSTTPGQAGRDVGTYASAGWNSDRWLFRASRLDTPENFNPELGFVRRRNVEDHLADFRFSPRPRIPHVRQVAVLSSLRYVQNQQGALETRERWGGFQVELHSGDKFTVGATESVEALDAPLPLARQITVAPGTYRTREWKAAFEPYRARKWQPAVTVTSGGFYDRHRTSIQLDGSYRPNAQWGLGVKAAVNLLDGREPIRTAVFTSRIEYSFSPALYVRSLLQWNSEMRSLGANLRLNLIHSRNSNVFLVYDETVDTARPQLHSRGRAVMAKFDYLFRF